MKKNLSFVIILLIISNAVFAEGISGIFGIEFGKSSIEVKSAMEEKGWKLTNIDGTTLTYQKSEGTYANLIVDNITLSFYEDKFYDAMITFSVATKLEDLITAVKAIRETYDLTFINNESGKMSGYDVILYYFVDSKKNIFDFVTMGNDYFSVSSFKLVSFSIKEEKEIADEKRKLEETLRKNESISSDL